MYQKPNPPGLDRLDEEDNPAAVHMRMMRCATSLTCIFSVLYDVTYFLVF